MDYGSDIIQNIICLVRVDNGGWLYKKIAIFVLDTKICRGEIIFGVGFKML